jgi:hypothetical protein
MWPDDVDREALIACAFCTRGPNETHRARLRVEIGRRARRWLTPPLAGFTTILLLPAALPLE